MRRTRARVAGEPHRAVARSPVGVLLLALAMLTGCASAADLAPAASDEPRVAGPSRGGFKEALAASARPSTIVQTAASTIPSVADRAGLPPPASRAVTARERLPSEHSREFLAWARRYDKLLEYCPDGAVPCAESLRREAVWRINARHIEEHNRRSGASQPPTRETPSRKSKTKTKTTTKTKAKAEPHRPLPAHERTGSLMKKGLTRFADMTSEEFTTNAATYSTPLLSVSSKAELRAELPVDVRRGERAAASAKERYLASHAADGDGTSLSLKLATDAAAAAGERLPSERGAHAEDDGHVEDGIFGSVFPALGSSRTTDATSKRGERSHERKVRKTSRGVDVATSARPRVGSAPSSGTSASEGAGPLGTNLPTHFDWSDVVDFGDVVHQGKCAGCWAYSTAAVIEAARLIDARATATRSGDADAASRLTTERLSPHALIDCDDLDRGCATGNMASAYSWIQTSAKGIPTMAAYPRRGRDGVCDESALGAIRDENVVRTEGYCDLPSLGDATEAQTLLALAQQPVAVGVNVHALQFYESGVVDVDDCPPASDDPLRAINHAAVLTGWGKDEATGKWYWILRNTYGEHWGEGGYARLAFGKLPGTNFGTCALYTEGNYPVLGDLQCTEGAVRKEAVKHGKHVWLYPGGYNMGPRDAEWRWPSWEEMRMMLASGGWPAGSEDGVAAVAVLGVVCAVIVAALVAARYGRRGARVGGGGGGGEGGEEVEGLLSAAGGGAAYGAAASP